ncbi:MAG: sulfite exporter TauE/SafE family protein [Alphaproteobacteria bacterium]|nr:sulfite exporter TauE/SafE family protein [Alphaproteobacteria bacterium]
MILPLDPVYVISGLAVGLLVGLTGVGGGSLMTPLLVLAFGVHPSTAVGTDLIYAAATKSVGAGVHSSRGSVDWRVVGWLSLGSLPAATMTLLVLGRHAAHLNDRHGPISETLGVALIVTALAILFRPALLAATRRAPLRLSARATAAATVLLGVALGVLVSVSSVGAGAIGMTVLLALYPALPVKRLVGSDIAHAVPLTLISGIGHWLSGTVDVGLLVSLLAGSVPGIVVGSLLSARAPEAVLRPILASTLALAGGRLLF